MEIFLTSDTHFGHKNIIRYCDRPFSSVEEMNECLVKNWNDKVGRNDVVWHLGDFCWYRKTIMDIVPRLNGKIKLVFGGHDYSYLNFYRKYKNVEVCMPLVVEKIDDCVIVLCHFQLISWEKKNYGSYHFYGHAHGNSVPIHNSFDVGVDVNQFRPLSLSEAIEKAGFVSEQ